MDTQTLTCEECTTSIDITPGQTKMEEVTGWVQLPCVMYGTLEWWTHCPECASPERQRESLDITPDNFATAQRTLNVLLPE